MLKIKECKNYTCWLLGEGLILVTTSKTENYLWGSQKTELDTMRFKPHWRYAEWLATILRNNRDRSDWWWIPPNFQSAAFRSILRQIGQCWKFGAEFVFGHSYLRYSSKLWPITQCTFVPLHFCSILRQIGQCWKLGGIRLWSFVPPLFLKTVANHSVYLRSAAFRSILRQIWQCWKFGAEFMHPLRASMCNFYTPWFSTITKIPVKWLWFWGDGRGWRGWERVRK